MGDDPVLLQGPCQMILWSFRVPVGSFCGPSGSPSADSLVLQGPSGSPSADSLVLQGPLGALEGP